MNQLNCCHTTPQDVEAPQPESTINTHMRNEPHNVRPPESEGSVSRSWKQNKQLSMLLVGAELFCIIFYSPWCLKYIENPPSEIGLQYTMFQHVSCMIFVGFGLLMVCSARLGISSIVTTFMIGSVCIQYGMLFHHFWGNVLTNHWKVIELSISDLVLGNFAAGTALISFGAVIGHVTPAQMIAATLIQIPLYSLNESILAKSYSGGIEAVDMGGSMFVHTFGAISGICMSKFLRRTPQPIPRSVTSYHSDIIAFIGTVVLWMYWPSFNGALAVGTGWYRVVLNTTLSLASSCVSSIVMAAMFSIDGNILLEIIQNASLAGGVMVGSSSDLVIGPYLAIIIGSVAGIISSWGFLFGKDMIKERLGVNDVCGVLWLHGIPGILGGLIGSLSAALADMDEYTSVSREQHQQAFYQLVALVVTLCMSSVTGYLMAMVANLFAPPLIYMSDEDNYEVAEDIPKKTE